MNRALSLSSCQSISLPIMLNNALLSIRTLTPSCSTVSSNAAGLSTYSKWYASPLHPLFFTPTRMSFFSGDSNKPCNCSTALGVNVMGAFLGRSLLFFGFAVEVSCAVEGFAGPMPAVDAAVGLLFCASPSLSLAFKAPSFRSHGAVGGQL